jgi:hypothetical protein
MALCLISRYSSVFSEAIAAIDRPVIPGLEWHLCPRAAFRAHGIEHFTGLPPVASATVAISLFCHAAILAAHRFICKTLLGKEFLITGGKDKVLAAVLASQRFVLVHFFLTRIYTYSANLNGSPVLVFYKSQKLYQKFNQDRNIVNIAGGNSRHRVPFIRILLYN